MTQRDGARQRNYSYQTIHYANLASRWEEKRRPLSCTTSSRTRETMIYFGMRITGKLSVLHAITESNRCRIGMGTVRLAMSMETRSIMGIHGAGEIDSELSILRK